MKKIILLLLLVSSGLVYSQPSAVQEMFGKYSGKDGFTSVNLNDLSSVMGGGLTDELKKEIGDVQGVKILTFDPKKNANKKLGSEFAADMKKIKLDAGFKEFMTVNEGETFVKMMVKKSNEKAKEFLMFVSEKNSETVMIWISGSLNLNNVGKIGEIFEGMKHNKGGKKSEAE